jgi:hypothetical protein
MNTDKSSVARSTYRRGIANCASDYLRLGTDKHARVRAVHVAIYAIIHLYRRLTGAAGRKHRQFVAFLAHGMIDNRGAKNKECRARQQQSSRGCMDVALRKALWACRGCVALWCKRTFGIVRMSISRSPSNSCIAYFVARDDCIDVGIGSGHHGADASRSFMWEQQPPFDPCQPWCSSC